mmetsp:Transcript_11173/g.16457  ORF Transcript_11173/g.16457 Transcript_11173/m.16457 type:complete len:205 (-) Transcript_11173:503-1117(-)
MKRLAGCLQDHCLQVISNPSPKKALRNQSSCLAPASTSADQRPSSHSTSQDRKSRALAKEFPKDGGIWKGVTGEGLKGGQLCQQRLRKGVVRGIWGHRLEQWGSEGLQYSHVIRKRGVEEDIHVVLEWEEVDLVQCLQLLVALQEPLGVDGAGGGRAPGHHAPAPAQAHQGAQDAHLPGAHTTQVVHTHLAQRLHKDLGDTIFR